MNLKTAIELLELNAFQDPDDLKRAFRARAHEFHPDKNPSQDAAQKFREIVRAYEWCWQHIEELHLYFVTQNRANRQSVAFDKKFSPEVHAHDLDGIFSEIFGYDKAGSVGWQPAEALLLTLEQLAQGGPLEVLLTGSIHCQTCAGLGAAVGVVARLCRYCFGKGFVPRRSLDKRASLLFGHRGSNWLAKYKLCRRCDGRGREILKFCKDCRGFGRRMKRHRHSVVLPVALQPGQVCRMAARDLVTGEESQVVFEVKLKTHPIFEIDNQDLICDYNLQENQLSKQQKIHFQTPMGPVSFVLPEGITKGQVLKIKGQGLYREATRSSRGDLLIHMRIKPVSWLRRICKRR